MRHPSRMFRFDGAQLFWKVGQSSPKSTKVQSTHPLHHSSNMSPVGALGVHQCLSEVDRRCQFYPSGNTLSPSKSGRVRSRPHRRHATILAAIQVRWRATFLESRPKFTKVNQSTVGPPLTPSLQTRPESIQQSSSCDPSKLFDRANSTTPQKR